MTREVPVSDENPKVEVLRRLVDAFNRQDLDAAVSLFADDCVFESSRGPDRWGSRFVGLDEVREGISGRFRTIPQGRYWDNEHVVFGDRGFSEWTLTGRTAEGDDIEVRGCDIWTFDGDKIVRKNSFWKIVER